MATIQVPDKVADIVELLLQPSSFAGYGLLSWMSKDSVSPEFEPYIHLLAYALAFLSILLSEGKKGQNGEKV